MNHNQNRIWGSGWIGVGIVLLGLAACAHRVEQPAAELVAKEAAQVIEEAIQVRTLFQDCTGVDAEVNRRVATVRADWWERNRALVQAADRVVAGGKGAVNRFSAEAVPLVKLVYQAQKQGHKIINDVPRSGVAKGNKCQYELERLARGDRDVMPATDKKRKTRDSSSSEAVRLWLATQPGTDVSLDRLPSPLGETLPIYTGGRMQLDAENMIEQRGCYDFSMVQMTPPANEEFYGAFCKSTPGIDLIIQCQWGRCTLVE